jgi:AAA+ superfamily predicted ATPase
MASRDSVAAHTLAHLSRLDVRVQREVHRLREARGQREDEDYRGLYVSEHDVDGLISPASPASEPAAAFEGALAAAEARIRATGAQCRAAGQTPRLDRLASLFSLGEVELDVVLIALAAEVDLRYERLYAYLQDDVTKKRPTVDLVFRLLGLSEYERLVARRYFEPDGPLLRWELVGVYDDPGARRPVLLSRFLKLDDRIAAYLLGSDSPDARIDAVCAANTDEHGRLPASVQGKLDTWSAGWRWNDHGTLPVVLLHGRYGAGHSAAAGQLAATFDRPVLQLDANAGAPDVPLARRLVLVEREAMLTDAVVCWSGVDPLLHVEPGRDAEHHTFTRALATGRVPTVLLAERAWEPGRLLDRRPFLRLELADPTYAERRDLWAMGLNGSSGLAPAELSALAARFRLSAGQIQDAITRARTLAWTRDPGNGHISADDIDAACRVQAQHRLGALARKLEPRYTWDDIVVPAPQLTTLRLISAMIRQRPVVYGEWGFDRKLAMGKGVIALFAGPSGTGKTMAAEILARDLGLDLYRIDLSSVVNKYIGETEKNLERLFSEAQNSDAVLFFDEADALFGKRSGVSDAHDRYANIETAYLLQRTEEYNGLVILASNLPKNMDDAFVRRVHFTVNFPAPEEPERLEIWRRTFPREAPRAADLDLEFLARRLKITGGNIRNIVLASAFLAAEDVQPIGMQHLIRAAGYEYQKMGKMLLESDFGKYFDLVRT